MLWTMTEMPSGDTAAWQQRCVTSSVVLQFSGFKPPFLGSGFSLPLVLQVEKGLLVRSLILMLRLTSRL